jgi:peptidoglycan/xylan/chitin deacetylase (PgdA/CDA1 family)
MRQVIFTFDAGAGTQSLSSILSVLRSHGLTATFFLTGKWADTNPVGAQQIASSGHEIFNHTYNHPNLTTVADSVVVAELSRAENAIRAKSGKTTKPYFRTPYGARNQHVLDVAWGQGYRSVYWTVDAWDWKEGISADEAKNRVLGNVNPGTIYLMHSGDTITGQILEELVTTIEARGYSIVPLSRGL